MKKLSLIFLSFALVFGSSIKAESASSFLDEIKKARVLDRGRVKPFDTVAEETTLSLLSRRSFKDPKTGDKMNHLSFYLSLVSDPKTWYQKQWLQVKHQGLRKILGLGEKLFVSPHFISQQKDYLRMLPALAKKKEADKRSLDGTETAALDFGNKFNYLNYIMAQGQLFDGLKKEAKGEIKSHVEDWQKFLTAFKENKKDQAEAMAIKVVAGSNRLLPGDFSVDQEITLNSLRPFRLAWVLYLIGFLLLILKNGFKKEWLEKAGILMALLGFSLHSYGFYLRMVIADRPPVTNMYESVIWVAFGTVFFALLFEYIHKKGYAIRGGLVFGFFSMLLADQAPAVLDPGIHPLEPVLRDNFWLTTHVLIITLSYAAFGLSFAVSNYALPKYLKKEKTETSKNELKFLEHLNYRLIQVGVVLLAGGTILGGIWADYSWGRFWGWDPKEVWALVALLCYLAVLHARYTGWMKPFGFAAFSIIAFSSVVMAWYGVNFVLGAGLHSYGFGGGGAKYMAGLIFIQLIFVLACYLKYKSLSSGQIAQA